MTTSGTTKETQQQPFWTFSKSKTVELLQTDAQNGLSEKEAEKRLKIFGQNIIEGVKSASRFFILLNQFKSPLILILSFAGIVMLFIGHYHDAFFIFAAVFINAVLGFYQENKAEKALAELKTYLKQRSRVVRDGTDREIDAANLVPGDIIRLNQGDRVPADGRLLFVNDFQVDEAILTGESLPILKSISPASDSAALGDQYSMIFAGTLVTQGIATAAVCRTDLSTELGKIATLVADSNREETPLQKAIKKFSARAGLFLGILTMMVFGIGISSGYSWADMFLTSVAVAVSAVPEGLPVAMTVILAIGVQRMARRKGVIRKLIAAESLGRTTVIMTDKTGTLTMAKMALAKILPADGENEKRLLELSLLNTNVLIENRHDQIAEWRLNGRALETALVRSAALRDVFADEVKKRTFIVNTLPFNAVNKFSVSLVNDNGKHTLVFFGAPDIFINHSTLDSIEQKERLEQISALAGAGELIMGVATKEIEAKEDFSFSKDLEFNQLSFRGLITLRDPVRPSVKEAIRQVELAGIKTVIMTGDHRGTACLMLGASMTRRASNRPILESRWGREQKWLAMSQISYCWMIILRPSPPPWRKAIRL